MKKLKKNMQRLVSMLLTAALLITATGLESIAVYASPESASETADSSNESEVTLVSTSSTSGTVTYTCDSGVVLEFDLDTGTITGVEENGAEYVEIPEEIEGIAVTAIGEWVFGGCTTLREIILPDTLTELGEGAFCECTALESITIPAGVTELSNNLFNGCTSLTSVVMSEGLQSVGYVAFIGCTSLTSISFPDSVLSIGSYTFDGCTLLTEVTLPESLEELGEGAFYGCTALVSITVPENVTKIGDNTFMDCTALESVVLPDGITEIGAQAFTNCTSLTAIVLPENLTILGDNAFKNCTALEEVEFGSSLEYIGEYAFLACSSLDSVELPDGLLEIDSNAFRGCTALTSVTFPDSLISVGSEAFMGCTSLQEVICGSGLETIGDDAFKWLESLQTVSLNENLKEIGDRAFQGCLQLTEISLPGSLETIGESAFYGCLALSEVTIPNTITEISEGAFRLTALETVTVPASVESIGDYAFDECYSLASIYILGTDTVLGESIVNDSLTDSLTFYGYEGSTAQTYASENGFAFSALDSLSRTLSVSVQLPDGTEITEGFDAVWYDADGNVVSQKAEFAGASGSETYTLEVTLGTDLLETYWQPEAVTVSGEGDVQCIITLEARTAISLSGMVTDSDGDALADVTVKVTRAATGSVQETVTGADGTFSLDTAADSVSVKYSKDGYYSVLTTCDLSDVTDSTWTLDTKALRATAADRISLSITLVNAAADGEDAVTVTVQDAGNYGFTITDEDGTSITEFEVQGTNLIFEEDIVSAGQTLTLTVSDPVGDYLPASVSVALDDACTGSADISLTQKGSFFFDEIDGPESVLLIFDSEGTLQSSSEAQALLSYGPMDAGTYTLVLIEKTELLRSVPSLTYLDVLGLEEGTDYLLLSLTITDGVITELSSVTVPDLDESEISWTTENTSLSVSGSSTMTQGAYFMLRVEYELEEDAGVTAENVQIVLPEGLEVTSSRVALVDNVATAYTYQSSSRTATVSVAGKTSAVIYLYCKAGTTVGTYAVSGYLTFTDGNMQAVGSAVVEVTNSTISVPSSTSEAEIVVSGTTAPYSTVSIYSNGTWIAETTSNAAGSWSTTVDLTAAGKVYSYSYHYIYAVITDSDGEQIAATDSCLVTYDARTAAVGTVTMYNTADYGEQETVIDFTSDSTVIPYYLYNPSTPTFTFEVEFTQSDSLSEVYVVTYDTWGDATYVSTTWNEATGTWVGTQDYERYSSIPAEISVEWSYDETLYAEIDEELLADLEEEYTEAMTELEETLAAYFDDYISFEDIEYEEGSWFAADMIVEDPDDSSDRMDGHIEVSLTSVNDNEIADALADGSYETLEVETEDGTAQVLYKDVQTDTSETVTFISPEEFVCLTLSVTFDAQEAEETAETELSLLSLQADVLTVSASSSVLYASTSSLASVTDTVIQSNVKILVSAGVGLVFAGIVGVALVLTCPILAPAAITWATGVAFTIAANATTYGLDTLETNKKTQSYYNLISGNTDKLYSLASEVRAVLNARCTTGSGDYRLSETDKTAYTAELENILAEISTYTATAQEELQTAYKHSTASSAAKALLGTLSGSTSNIVDDSTTSIVSNVDTYAMDYYEGAVAYIKNTYSSLYKELTSLKKRIKAAYQDCDDDDDEPPETEGKTTQKKVGGFADPSGYVYEAVPSNRLEGVTATIYYQDSDGEKAAWDAENYNQVSPQTTGSDGVYQWYVPEGNWLVTFEKDGYQDADTSLVAVSLGYENGWLEVAPPQLNINVAMVSQEAPEVASVAAYTEQVILTFSQYMDIDSVLNAVSLLIDGESVQVTVSALDAEYDLEEENQYATRFSISTGEDLTGEIVLTVAAAAENYAGTPMESAYESDILTAGTQPESLNVSENITIELNSTGTLSISLYPCVSDVVLEVENLSPSLFSIDAEEITTDEEGNAQLLLTGLLPGVGYLTVTEPVSGLSIQVTVTVSTESTEAETGEISPVTAYLEDGTVLESGMTIPYGSVVTLVTETEGATIRYTVNDTCPCKEAALYYTEPLVLTEDTVLRAAACIDGVYSSTIRLELTVQSEADSSGEDEDDSGSGSTSSGSSSDWYDEDDEDDDEDVEDDDTEEDGDEDEDEDEETTGTLIQIPSDDSDTVRFTDVPAGSYFEDAVIWAVENGITTGTSSTTFSPDDSITRAQLVTFLYRLAGTPDVDGLTTAFTDISGTDCAVYYDAIVWACNAGITLGTSEITFSPHQTVTRAEAVTFLHRYYGEPAAELLASVLFDDVEDTAYYADAAAWAVVNGITTGTTETTFSPDEACTRAQAVTFLYRAEN